MRLESARRLLDRLVEVPCFFLFSRPPSAPGLVFRHYSAQPPLLKDNPHGSAVGLQRICGYDLEASSRLAHVANDPESFGTLSIDQVQAAAIYRDRHVRLGLTINCHGKTDAGYQSLASNRSILQEIVRLLPLCARSINIQYRATWAPSRGSRHLDCSCCAACISQLQTTEMVKRPLLAVIHFHLRVNAVAGPQNSGKC